MQLQTVQAHIARIRAQLDELQTLLAFMVVTIGLAIARVNKRLD